MPSAIMAESANAPMTAPMMIGVVLVEPLAVVLVLEEDELTFAVLEGFSGAAESVPVPVPESGGSGAPSA